MGTSNSTGGPGDRTPLLPSWALPGGGGGDGGDGSDGDGGADGSGDGGGDGTGDGGPDGSGDGSADGGDNGGDPGGDEQPAAGGSPAGGGPPGPTGSTHAPAAPPAHWRSAKRRLGAAVTGRTGRAGIARAGRAYVRALGGSRRAAQSVPSARASSARLGGFLADVSGRGLGAALDAIGLGRLVGSDSHTVFAAIVDALAPEGADLEQMAAREAVNETLAELFEQYVAPDGSVAALESMTPDAIRSAVERSVAASIYHRWLGDLEKQLEEKAVTAAEAVRLERDVAAYIRETVKLDLRDRDPLKLGWGTAEGAAFMETIYRDAYAILGSAE